MSHLLEVKNLDVKLIKEKLYIELIWNDYIYQKFYNKVIVDREKIKKEILNNPEQENQRELLLSEINFSVTSKIDFEDKYKKILSGSELGVEIFRVLTPPKLISSFRVPFAFGPITPCKFINHLKKPILHALISLGVL